MNILDKILIGLAAVILGGALALTTYTTINTKQNLAGNFNPTGAGTYLIQSSITSSQSTITLSASTPFNEPASNIPYTMTYLNSNIEYGTLNPASGQPGVDNSEFISFTGITQNTNGSATLTGVTRGLARTPGTGGCVASSTLAHAYPSQTKFILSNSPCFYSQYAVKQNNETILGAWTFSSTSPPKLDYDPTAAQWAALSSSSLVTYHLLASTALAGATNASVTAKGIVQLASSTQAASSTDIGTSGAEQVLMAKYATDTPQNCSSGARAGGCVVMSLLTGKISQLWLDLTQAFSFSGSLTSTASTTIAASDLTTHSFTLNGVTYKFPPLNGASSTVLTTDGAGTLLWLPPKVTTLSVVSGNATTVQTSTSSLQTVLIPANALTTSSQLQFTAAFTEVNAPGTGFCYYGVNVGTGLATTTIGYASNNQSGTPLLMTGLIAATTTTSAFSQVQGTYLPINTFTVGGSPTTYNTQFLNMAFSGKLYIDFNASRGSSNGAQACILTSESVEVLNN